MAKLKIEHTKTYANDKLTDESYTISKDTEWSYSSSHLRLTVEEARNLKEQLNGRKEL